jgi:glycosyltransferase involved in cell wall biosynthesis
MSKAVSIVIPVFNEEKYIKEILIKINLNKKIYKEIIIVDDGSTDGTKNIIIDHCKNLYSKAIFLEKNFGKGHALRKGFEAASGEILLVQDADLEYDPKDYEKLLHPIFYEGKKVVYGSRVIKGGYRTRPKSYDTLIRMSANYFLTFFSNIFNNQNLTDAHTCYKVFYKNILLEFELEEDGFNFCPEITAKISKLGIKIHEVPINYYGRTHEEGKKISFIDGFRAMYAILKHNIFK